MTRPFHSATALALLAIEIVIAARVPMGPIRTHAGDVLAVMLVHFGLRAVTPLGRLHAAAAALATAFAIEAAQAFGLGDALGLAPHALLRLLLGSRFDPLDLLAYGLGACAALAVEASRSRWYG